MDFRLVIIFVCLFLIIGIEYLFYLRKKNKAHIQDVVFGRSIFDNKFSKLLNYSYYYEHFLECTRRLNARKNIYYAMYPEKKPKRKLKNPDLFGIENGIARELPPHKKKIKGE